MANVSHELRTPLNMVIGFAETILQAPHIYGKIPPALLADLTIILRNSQHLADLIDDVLDLSQIEARQMALSKEWVSLPEVIEAATLAVRPLFASKHLDLRVEVAADLPLIFCDRTRIREVLLNLLSNAGRFTERGGVYLRAWREGNDVLVSVADTGPGIAAKDQERLFRPFEQLDGSIRRRHGGTGLGLSISKRFVELHGGKMWLESALGRGSTFFFRLPIEQPVVPPAGGLRWMQPEWEYRARTSRPELPPPTVRPRLVVVETGQSLTRLLTRYLGHVEIVTRPTPSQAAEELARTPAQALLINDASLEDALSQLHTWGDLPEDIPVMVCFVPGTAEAAEALGVADYLLKPVSREALRAVLDRLHLASGTILVVDDDPEATRLFRRMLNSFGRNYRVLTTNEGQQALHILREERPAILLLDLVMPDPDGFQLLQEKGRDPTIRDIPVVILSAKDPFDQPTATKALIITRESGLAVPQLLTCLEALCGALAPTREPASPAPPIAQPG